MGNAVPNVSSVLRSEYAALDVQEVLGLSVGALLGVSAEAENALWEIGIATIFDLGSSWLFANARAAVGLDGSTREGAPMVPGDLLRPGSNEDSLDRVASFGLEKLSGISVQEAETLASALDVESIRDFAVWPPQHAARRIVGQALGSTEDVTVDEAEELRPRLGEYPTERVYYSKLVLLQMEEAGESSVLDGPISLTPVVEGVTFGKPAVGVLLTYSQSWHAKGLTLGQMLHSLALAPGEATRIAVIDWSRRTRATAAETISEAEQLDNAAQHSRAMSEITNLTANDLQSGGSTTTGWSKSSGAGAAGGISIGPISLGGSAQKSTTNSRAESTSWSVGTRSVLGSMSQNVNDSTEQHASSVRSRRASAVREVSQTEHEEISTRVVANYNHMHALTVQYYEVVQLYEVVARLHRADRCLFVPFELLNFSGSSGMDVVETFRGQLAAGALTERARNLLVDPTTTVALTPKTQTVGPMQPSVGFPAAAAAAAPGEIAAASGDPAETTTTAVSATLFTPMVISALVSIARDLGRPVTRPGSRAFHLPDDTELLALSFEGVNLATVRLERPGVGSGDNTFPVPSASSYVELPSGVRLRDLDGISVARAALDSLHAGTMMLQCRQQGRYLVPVPVALQLKPNTTMQRVLDLETDEIDRRRELLAHLQANRGHYTRAVLERLDSSDLVLLLSRFKWNGKPVVDQVEPTPLAVAGNYLVLRAPAELSDLSGVKENDVQLSWGELLTSRGIRATQTEHGTTFLDQPDRRLVPVPTSGVFAEAVLGRSNSAEKLDITRFWNWQDSPIPLQPPEIAPIAAGSRAMAEDLKPGSLGQPVLNIVNPSSLPDPAGLGAAYNALANLNFRDMSGLAGTQEVAKSASEGTLTAATAAGEQASKNMATEAQKAVAMAQIAADVAKASMGIPPTGSTKGISADGARINHGREMDERGVSSSGKGVSPGQATSRASRASNVAGAAGGRSAGSAGSDSQGRPVASRERSYADRAAHGYSPDTVAESVAATTTSSSQAAFFRGSTALARAQKARSALMSTPGKNIVSFDDDNGVIRGGVLIADFDVDSCELKAEAIGILEQLAVTLNEYESALYYIEGRASQTGPETHNVELSFCRADAVHDELAVKGGVSYKKLIDNYGLGSSDPIVDNRGFEEPLNRSVRVVYQIPLPPKVKVTTPPQKATGSKKWAVRLQLSGSAGHAGLGGAFAYGQIKNLESQVVKTGTFQGGGIGVGLQSPGADPGWGDWEEFETDQRYTFEDFDGCLARLTMVGVGVALFGYSFAYLSFPTLGANTISVGGWNMGAIGADGSSNVGWWNVID